MLSRTELLIGSKIDNLKKSKIIIFGLGGVGGYVAEMLVRSGIENITIVDFDKVDITNKNRQIIAINSTIGKFKTDALKDRLLDINENCKILAINEKLSRDNIHKFNLSEYDYIVDAIDMVSSKIALIEFAYKNNIPIISAMGAGNRFDIPHFEVKDIYQTSNDKLAKVLRHELRKIGVEHHTVVCSNSMPINCGEHIGSISYYPAVCGCVLSAYVINKIIGENV